MTKTAKAAWVRIFEVIEDELEPLDGPDYLAVCEEIEAEGESRAGAYREEHKDEVDE